jgi:4-diphosphocytidyl-2-C-methyl-D-erythritol kinase
MPKLTALAPAKINLTFDILGTMADGYHEVETILQSIDLADRLIFDISPADTTSTTITTERVGIPLGEDNLIAKAVKLFCEKTEWNYDVKVNLEKNIPVGAGLAGGSADAAATLIALNTVSKRVLREQDLLSLARELGADVPFCIAGGTKFGTGRGDILEQCHSQLNFVFCIVKPRALSISTPWAYKQFDNFNGEIRKPRTKDAIKQLERGDMERALLSFGNVFQPVMFSQHSELAELHTELQKQGAWYSQLSGSGPAIFAIDPDLEHAHFLRRKMFEFSSDLEIHFCQSIKTGIAITEHEHGQATR